MSRSTDPDGRSHAPAQWLPALAMGAAICSIGLASVWLVIAERELTPAATIFDRLALASVVLGIWQGIAWLRSPTDTRTEPLRTPATVGLLLIAGASFSISLLLLGWSLTRTSVAVGTLLYNSVPIFTAVLGWLFLGRRYSLRFLLGTLVAIVGIATIGFEDLMAAEVDFIGDAASLFAASLAAVALLCFEELRKEFSSQAMMAWVSAIGSVLLLPLLLVRGEALWPHDPSGWIAVICLAVVSQAIGQSLLTYTLGSLAAGTVAVFMLLIPVVSAVASAILFSERLSLQAWMAFAVVLGGIYLAVSARSSREISPSPGPVEVESPS